LHFDYIIDPVVSTFQIDPPPFRPGDRWIVWSLAGLIKNVNERHRPDVRVEFRRLIGDGPSGDTVSDNVVYRHIAIQLAGQLKIGTVVEGNRITHRLRMVLRRFMVDFTEGTWSRAAFVKTLHEEVVEAPYPYESWPLGDCGERDRNDDRSQRVRHLKFPIIEASEGSGGGYLSIPSLEFFSRLYGRSQEVKRILTTYPWGGEKGAQERLYTTPVHPDAAVKWGVHLGKRLKIDDAVYVACLKNDPYAKAVSKEIYQSFAEFRLPAWNRDSPFSPPISPWFQGTTEIDVLGIPLEGDTSFLGLCIVGCEEPQGSEIVADLSNTNKVREKASGDGQGKGWEGSPEREEIEEQDGDEKPELIKITSTTSPGRTVKSRLHMADADFKIIGKRRKIRQVIRDKAATSAAPRTEAERPEKSAPTGGVSHDKNVGLVTISAKSVEEQKAVGPLNALWNSARALVANVESRFDAVQLYTGSGYTDEEEPRFISLVPAPAPDEDEKTKATRSWASVGSGPRCALVFRMRKNETWFHFIDIQKRPGTRESFAGLVFVLEDGQSLNDKSMAEWLAGILLGLHTVSGVIGNLLMNNLPGDSHPFSHWARGKGDTRYTRDLERAVLKLETQMTEARVWS